MVISAKYFFYQLFVLSDYLLITYLHILVPIDIVSCLRNHFPLSLLISMGHHYFA
jgi:hypothetical protein